MHLLLLLFSRLGILALEEVGKITEVGISTFVVATVPLNYNFILTRVSTSGATKYFACQMPEFPVEIQISTRRDVAFRRGIYMRHGTWHFTRDGIVTFTRDVVVLTKLNNWQDSICL